MTDSATTTADEATADPTSTGVDSPAPVAAAGTPAPTPVPAESAVAAADSVEAAGRAVTERPVVTEKASFDDVEEAMRDVVDPELGINVVDLGLVYGINITDENTVVLDMTLTSAACPLTDVIEDQTRSALVDGPDNLVNDVTINWVWMPPWGPDKITDDGREQLRALGFNV